MQYVSDLFWKCWCRECLPQLQQKQKWNNTRRNFFVGDIVLVVDDSAPRNSWMLARVIETIPDKKGLVRQVRIKTKTNNQHEDGWIQDGACVLGLLSVALVVACLVVCSIFKLLHAFNLRFMVALLPGARWTWHTSGFAMFSPCTRALFFVPVSTESASAPDVGE